MKLHLTEYPILDEEQLKAEHEIVDDYDSADVVIYFSTEQYENKWPREKAIMAQVEPPLAAYRQLVYDRKVLDHFYRAYVFNPDPDAPNQFLVTTKPHVFPYRPRERRHRENTQITSRKWYYAGDRYQQWSAPDAFGSINLYPARTILVEKLMEYGELPYCVMGRDWVDEKVVTRGVNDWRTQKLDEIDTVQADFVLCQENSRYLNYISEKIHDGFNSDRVVFYLGAPNIEEFIPGDCFVNMSKEPYWSPEHKQVNWKLVHDRMKEMTQTEYDEILGRAREFKDTKLTMNAYHVERAAITRHVMAMLRNLG